MALFPGYCVFLGINQMPIEHEWSLSGICE